MVYIIFIEKKDRYDPFKNLLNALKDRFCSWKKGFA